MKITHTQSSDKGITLVDVVRKRVETKQKIAMQKEKIAATYADILSPISNIASGPSFLNRFKTGINLFNGIIVGFNLMKKFRKYFHKKR
ncbi:hypothetical protein SAMN05444405_12157 [Bacteroides luti]|jgi:hypothetical protein|uniref:Uncharacterized protein n=1 Tax=Bacteroides luti TaxID=1297750 RepID=A0A1M5GML9_9BACE|nr:hypothetical protein [Bacteroides luti]SHG05030.1 hypothetical protein SAMN05444405_12157 [Bacteroides luti]